ncbi:MAG: hypothetical protein EXS35_10720 [Pedosphaera sp.]|nr:hypothetical protein [Pedosphaera sp.]
MKTCFRRARLSAGLALAVVLALAAKSPAADQTKTAEDLAREKAIAEFTAKMKAANYPALFEQAAAEFGVPADILKGVAFAETRWEHLTWPLGETRSPETGMPRPFGIMSLWDNEFFGHSLTDAAKLIGKDPEDLKKDPLTNMRGGAALLKKHYDENPKPDGTTTGDIESWRYAIVKYCGIPEPDLSQRHGLEVYEHLNKGYHQYGIEWNARPVNLAPMRAEVKRIVAEEARKREERMKLEEQATITPATGNKPLAVQLKPIPSPMPEAKVETSTPPVEIATAQTPASNPGGIWWLVGVLALLLLGTLLALRRRGKT